jgi:hypothetical protein
MCCSCSFIAALAVGADSAPAAASPATITVAPVAAALATVGAAPAAVDVVGAPTAGDLVAFDTYGAFAGVAVLLLLRLLFQLPVAAAPVAVGNCLSCSYCCCYGPC